MVLIARSRAAPDDESADPSDARRLDRFVADARNDG
jgi:hypothetical protein